MSNVEIRIGALGQEAILSIPQPYSTLYNSDSTIQSVKQGMTGPPPKVLFAKDDPIGLR